MWFLWGSGRRHARGRPGSVFVSLSGTNAKELKIWIKI